MTNLELQERLEDILSELQAYHNPENPVNKDSAVIEELERIVKEIEDSDNIIVSRIDKALKKD